MFGDTVHRQFIIHDQRFEFCPAPTGNPGNLGS
jgi:hypothetical protein